MWCIYFERKIMLIVLMLQFTHASSEQDWEFLRTVRQTDGLSAYQHGSLSFSPRNKAALYSSGTAANTADTDGGLFSESAWTCTSLWINPNQPADHSNWLFGDFSDRLRRNYWLTLEFVCLPHLSSWQGKLTHILWRKQESLQSLALRIEVGVYSQFYQILATSQWGFPWFSATFLADFIRVVNSIDLFHQNGPTAVWFY